MSLDCLSRLNELQDTYFFRLPYAYIIGDYVWPGILMSPERVKEVRNLEFRPDDILLVSYPKSGTTWMAELLSALMHKGDTETLKKFRQEVRVPWLELDQQTWWIRYVLKLAPLGWHAPLSEKTKTTRRVYFTHLPLEMLPKSVLEGACKVVYVARNPKDNAVSFFHHHRMARFLGLQKNLNWDEFFALYVSGSVYCGSWFEHVLAFWRLSRQQPERVHFVRFEDMKMNMATEVDKLMRFLGMELEGEQLALVFEHCTFEAMKHNKMANRDISWLFDTNICKFMRKGQIGDWRNYFTFAQNAFFDSLYKERLQSTGLEFNFGKAKEEEEEEEEKGHGN